MSAHFTITRGEPAHVAVHAECLGMPIHSTISGHVLSALVDGSLWYTINRMLERFVASAVPPAVLTAETRSLCTAIDLGEGMVHYVFTQPFHMADDERAHRIMRTINNNLPALEPLINAGSNPEERRAAWVELRKLASILQARIGESGALHGLEGISTINQASAAA